MSGPSNAELDGLSGVPAGQTGYIASNCWNLGSSLSSGLPGSIPRWETETGTGTNVNSLNTGLHYDNTSFGQSGGIYIYMECSGGVQNDSAYVLSPEYDLSGLSNPQLSFSIHMYGATGQLACGCGTTAAGTTACGRFQDSNRATAVILG